MELYRQRGQNRDTGMSKTTSTDEERRAQREFAQSVPIIEREEKTPKTPGKPRRSS